MLHWITPIILREHFNVSETGQTTVCLSQSICCEVQDMQVVECYEIKLQK